MTKKYNSIYETPDTEIIDISTEGVLCASPFSDSESYNGEDEYEQLF